MKMKYIPPILVKSSTLKGINKYSKRKDEFLYSMLNDNQEDTSNFATINFEDLFDENLKAIVLGEPGCGKSELVTQIKNQGPERSKKIIDCNLTSYTENALIKFVNDGIEDSVDNIFCFDALDEVDSNIFPKVVKFISRVNEKYPKSSIIVTCRSYYIENNLSFISVLSDFQFVLVDLFDEVRVKKFINNTIRKSDLKEFLLNKLKEGNKSGEFISILQIPRYLKEICKVIIDNKYDVNDIKEWKRSDYFEKAIYFKLQTDIKKRKWEIGQSNELKISQRMLEKLALIMEIKRTNRISKDEFISMLDDINSNINTSFLDSFDIDLFISRTLKKTDNYIEFHNTEFQEYLAAKEIIRHKLSEQELYELIVDSDLGHIYSNWYDVLRFVIKMYPSLLLPIANFLVNKRDGLADEQLLKLLKESNIKELSKDEKGRLFDILYTYFQSHEIFLHNYVNYLIQLYTRENYVCFNQVIAKDNKMRYSYRIHNQFYLTSYLINEKLFNETQKKFWIGEYVKYSKNKSDVEIQKASIYALADTKQESFLMELKDKDDFIISVVNKLELEFVSNLKMIDIIHKDENINQKAVEVFRRDGNIKARTVLDANDIPFDELHCDSYLDDVEDKVYRDVINKGKINSCEYNDFDFNDTNDFIENNENNENKRGYSSFYVFYGTDRKIEKDNKKWIFGNKRDDNLHLGISTISIPNKHRKGSLESPAWRNSFLLHESPKKHFTVLNIEDTHYDRFIELLKSQMDSEGKDVLLFIHGFNVKFKDALKRTAQLGFDLRFNGAVTAFSWPSIGTLLGYNADMDTAKLSSKHLSEFLKVLISGEVNKLHIIAHSMGNVVLTEALQTLKKDVNFPYDKINQIILAAPDIDKDIFLNFILPAIKGKPRLTLYASDKDKALKLSKTIRNNYIRLGEGGKNIVVADDFDSIDASRVDTNLLGHGYFAETQSLIFDIHMVLLGLSPNERILETNYITINGKRKPYWRFQRT